MIKPNIAKHWQAVNAAREAVQCREAARIFDRNGLRASADAMWERAKACEARVLDTLPRDYLVRL